jgi:GTP-binding protein LepA
MTINSIRNFCIIAHIDHGKSTLADRLLQYTGAISEREFKDQILDDMDIERERGITIKAKTVRFTYRDENDKEYMFNLIDTPGHVDFVYEVSKSLSACEGALLVIDAVQGIQAQTISNLLLAKENNLKIIPVINKIDLPVANLEMVIDQMENVCPDIKDTAILASAKKNIGTDEILENIVKIIPPPEGSSQDKLKALIFDSVFDYYRGVIVYIRIVDGYIAKDMKIKFMSTEKIFQVKELGVFTPNPKPVERLEAGEVGYVIANIKGLKDVRIGETITQEKYETANPFPGYRSAKPMVFCSLYPSEGETAENLRNALERLQLNDASFSFEAEKSPVLGFGFRCGFLGLLHMEIVQERLEREYDLDIIITAPTTVYKVKKTGGDYVEVNNPMYLPPPTEIEDIEEPFIRAMIITPYEHMTNVAQLVKEHRGEYIKQSHIDNNILSLSYNIPLGEMIIDFYDRLKSVTKGYGTLDYEPIGFRCSPLVRLDILLNSERIDSFSCLIHKDKAYSRGRKLARKLKETLPRQQFRIIIQAAIGNKIVAREEKPPFRKDVTEKLYGGDVTRKRKLLEKQKRGKKRMKNVGRISIPQEAFMAILKIN